MFDERGSVHLDVFIAHDFQCKYLIWTVVGLYIYSTVFQRLEVGIDFSVVTIMYFCNFQMGQKHYAIYLIGSEMLLQNKTLAFDYCIQRIINGIMDYNKQRNK